MAYHHSERYILVLSHDEVVHGKCSMLNKQPGDMDMKFMGLRTSYGFMFGHPGKKLLFMGQDFGHVREWSEERSLDWYLLDDPKHRGMHNWVKALLHLNTDYKALYATDYSDGFQWINCDDNEKSIVTFMRKSPDGKKSLVFVCNFTPVVWNEGYRVGVPNAGTYKEILNSNAVEFGGNDECLNGNVKAAMVEWDNQPYSIPVKVPPMGCVIFEYTHKYPKTPEQLAEEKAKKAAKKTTAKKGATKKSSTTAKAAPAKKSSTTANAATTKKSSTTAKAAATKKSSTTAKATTTKSSSGAAKAAPAKKSGTTKTTTTKNSGSTAKKTTVKKDSNATKTTAVKKDETTANTVTTLKDKK